MKLVQRHIIQENHRFYPEIDRLCFLSKNLYNYANYAGILPASSVPD
ncbi:hypothetical protein [Dapis sp. BLCC M229]